MSHTCSAPRCSVKIADGMLMCYEHWRLVPGGVQRRVYDSWKATRRGSTESRLQAVNQYRAAVAEANQAVEKMGPLF